MDFRIGPWVVRPGTGDITRDGETRHLTPKSMELLVFLAERQGLIATKDDIFRAVWRQSFVSDDALTRCIGELRRAFGDDSREPSTIRTIAKRGYLLLPPVIRDELGGANPEWSDVPVPQAAVAGESTAFRRLAWKHRWALLSVTLTVLAAVFLSARGGGLTAATERPGGMGIRRLAVLPLTDLSGSAEQAYFADGMTEELITELAQVDAWRVISRTSVMQYKGTRKRLPEIARDLSVDAVIEGTVLRYGNRVRITTQLIAAASDTHLWSGSFERQASDVLELQREIAQAVAAQLRIRFNPRTSAGPERARTVDPIAHEAYLKGMFHLNKFTPEGFNRGIAYLQQAVERDPSDPGTHAALALGYALMGHDQYPDALSRAKAAARKSLALGGPLAAAHTALAMQEMYEEWDLSSAGRDFRRALELNPSFAEARRHYSWYLRLLGQREEGIAEMKRAAALDPLSPQIAADLAWQHLFEGQLDSALTEARNSLELDSGFAQALAIAGWVYAERGMFEDAIALQEKAARVPVWKWPLGRTYALMHRRDAARAVATDLEKKPGPMDQWGLAVIYAALGDSDNACRWLEAAAGSRFGWMPWANQFAVPSQDVFANVRRDRRFETIMRRVGVPRVVSE